MPAISFNVYIIHQNKEAKWSRGMTVGARRAGLRISTTTDIGKFHAYQSLEFDATKKNHPVRRKFCGWNHLVDGKGQRRIVKLVQAHRMPTVNQITILYICGEQKTISVCTTYWSLRQMGYNSRKRRGVPIPVSQQQKQKAEAILDTDSLKLDRWGLTLPWVNLLITSSMMIHHVTKHKLSQTGFRNMSSVYFSGHPLWELGGNWRTLEPWGYNATSWITMHVTKYK